MSKKWIIAQAGFAALLLSGAALRADEGMWTYDNFPAAQVKAKYGFAPDAAWLDHVRKASVRLTTGCSASVVSKNGLVLTNHHCVVECVQNLSTPSENFVTKGVVTKNASEEKQCKGMQAETLAKIEDVTPQVKDAIAKATDPKTVIKARDAQIASIESQDACKAQNTRCQVVNLYQGGQYKLYTYRIYPDVRLAFAPEIGTAFFGGDPDNFNFPRYALDSAFVRLYDNGKPIETNDFLAFSTEAPKENDVVFVSGNPGTTNRLFTTAQLEMQRDWVLPIRQTMRSELRGRLINFMAQSEENKRIGTDLLFGIENSFKAQSGQWRTLMDVAFMDSKRKEETTLRSSSISNAKLKSEIGDPWSDMTKAMAAYRDQFMTYEFLEARAGGSSSLFSLARKLVRAADERSKPNAERLREYSDSKLALLEHEVLADNPVYPELEKITLAMWLSKAREYLTVDNAAVKTLLAKDSPEGLAERLVTDTKLGDVKVREQLWKGGIEAIKASNDPLIKYVLKTDAESRKVRTLYDETVDAQAVKASQNIAKARFALYGDKVYPDATFTLRLSYGAVKGWEYQGTTVPAYTQFSGLYERATGSEPFNLMPRWEAAKAKVTMSTPFDVSSTNDIIGGNSGSPLIDKEGRVVGAVFDGNIHSLGGSYGYDEKLNRTVSVSTPAILEAMRKVYDTPALADELEGKATGSIQ